MIQTNLIDFKGSWSTHLPLFQFAYNNSYIKKVSKWHLSKLFMEEGVDHRFVGIKLGRSKCLDLS